MYVLVSSEKFATLEADALASGEITEWKKSDEYNGSITTKDVTISYQYDPTYQRLNFEIGARHSLAAHMASDNIIGDHITKLISNIPVQPSQADSAPVPEA